MPDKRPLPARLYERGTVRGTLPMALAHLLARHLASRGVDPASILPLLPASPGDAVLGRCAAEDFCRWLLQAAEVLDDPLLGLHVGQSIDPVHLGPLGYALLNCENLGAALGQMLGPALPAARVAEAVEQMVEVYLRERQEGERFLDTFRRTGVAPFKEAVYADAH